MTEGGTNKECAKKYSNGEHISDIQSVTLTELEQNIDDMLENSENTMDIKESKKGFSIERALEKMDSIIGEDVTDKLSDILGSLTESEKEVLLNTLKKKD